MYIINSYILINFSNPNKELHLSYQHTCLEVILIATLSVGQAYYEILRFSFFYKRSLLCVILKNCINPKVHVFSSSSFGQNLIPVICSCLIIIFPQSNEIRVLPVWCSLYSFHWHYFPFSLLSVLFSTYGFKHSPLTFVFVLRISLC